MAQQQQQRPILNRPISLLNRNGLLLLLLLALFVILGVLLPLTKSPLFLFPNTTSSSSLSPSSSSSSSSSSLPSISDWRDYSLAQAAKFVAKNETVIVCAVSYPFLSFLSNWLISISRQKHHEKVLVIAEDYATLYKVNEKWPGHAVLIPPALDPQSAHKFGSQGFYNLTSRRPQHLLNILELGYNVMYNDVDMVWLQDPFDYLQGSHDVYFMDDMIDVKPLNHSHDIPPLSPTGVTYVCSCMIFLRSTDGAKLLMKKWVKEIQAQRWSNTEAKKPHDQPAFNRALHKTTHQVDAYLLPQSAFPSGGLYFRNETWVNETKGKHVIVHNNYIIGYDKKMKRFQDFNLWLLDDHALESPLGILKIYQEQQNTTEGKNQRKTGRKQRRNRGKKQKLP